MNWLQQTSQYTTLKELHITLSITSNSFTLSICLTIANLLFFTLIIVYTYLFSMTTTAFISLITQPWIMTQLVVGYRIAFHYKISYFQLLLNPCLK